MDEEEIINAEMTVEQIISKSELTYESNKKLNEEDNQQIINEDNEFKNFDDEANDSLADYSDEKIEESMNLPDKSDAWSNYNVGQLSKYDEKQEEELDNGRKKTNNLNLKYDVLQNMTAIDQIKLHKLTNNLKKKNVKKLLTQLIII